MAGSPDPGSIIESLHVTAEEEAIDKLLAKRSSSPRTAEKVSIQCGIGPPQPLRPANLIAVTDAQLKDSAN